MKYSILILLLTVSFPALAQNTVTPLSVDSTRSIELREIQVSSKDRNDRQRMLNFYKANNTSGLEDILSRLPELSLIRRGSYGMEPALRSLSAGQINVLIDGMRIHGACTDKMDPVTIYIEPLNLENLEVQTGTNGFVNGSSIGGTINLKMANPTCHPDQQLHGLFSSGYQVAARSLHEALQLNYNTGKWSVLGSTSWRKSSNYRSGYGKKIPFSQFEKVNYSLSAKYQLNQQTYFKADYIGDNGWNIGYPALPMDVGNAVARIGSISIQHESPGKPFYKWIAKIYGNQVRHYMDDTHRPDVLMHMDMPGKSLTYGFYSEAEMKPGRKQQLRIIADASSTRLKASMTMYEPGQLPMYMLTWPDNRKDQAGAGISWEYTVDSNWILRAALRLDYIHTVLTSQEAKDHISILGVPDASRTELLKNSSFAATRKISAWLKSSVSIAYAERMPTATELYGFYLFNAQDGYDYLGNPALQPEQSLQGELSFLLHGKKGNFRATFFYNHISHFINGMVNPSFSTMTIGAHGVKNFSALPDAGLAGIESSLLLKPVKQLDIISTLRYTNGKDNTGDPLPMIAPLKSVSSVRYQFSNLFLQLESETAAAQHKISSRYGEDKTGGYALLHIRSGYRFVLLGKKTDLQSGIENVLDKKYHEHLDWGNVARPGRNIYVTLRWVF